jgi:hypothetical protein
LEFEPYVSTAYGFRRVVVGPVPFGYTLYTDERKAEVPIGQRHIGIQLAPFDRGIYLVYYRVFTVDDFKVTGADGTYDHGRDSEQ